MSKKDQEADDTKEKMSDFISRHATQLELAKGDHEQLNMEVGPEILKIIAPNGLGGKTSMWWKGIRVFETGTMTKTLEEEQIPMHQRMYRDENTVVISGGST